VVAAMTRGFFQAFVSGQIDATQPGKTDITPLGYKKIIADNYEKLSALPVARKSYMILPLKSISNK